MPAARFCVPTDGNTFLKLYNLINGNFKEVTVANIAARNAYNVIALPTNVFVIDDGDSKWALYKATTTGTSATYIKISDPDLLNAVMTPAEVKTAYESNANTNAFTDALLAKLNGIAAGATINSTDAQLRDRATHTGTQLAATISNFTATVRATLLTGLDIVSTDQIQATDTILEALAKLQAQIVSNVEDQIVDGVLDKAPSQNSVYDALLLKLNASDYTALDVRSKLLTVDGPGSGIDSDYLDGHNSDYFQIALGYTAENVANKGVANGYAGLDSSGLLLLANFPDSVLGNLKYGGTYNGTVIDASDDFPELDGVDLPTSGYTGVYYIVTTDFTRAGTVYAVGDWIIHNGSNNYTKVDNSDAVTTVFGRLGNVVANAGDYTTALVTEDPSYLYFTTDRAKAVISATSPIFYNSTTGVISSQAAGAAQEGYVTTGTQTFAGTKTFSTTIVGSISGNAATATALATGRTISITGDIAYTSGSFDGSGNVTGAGTLASIISAGGPIGSATVVPIITYDAKGRLTAVSSTTITPAIGSITGLGTGVATALAVNIGSAGAFITYNGNAGTPSALVGTNISGTANGLSIGGSAPTLTNSRNFWGQAFNGSADVTGAMSGVNTISMSGTLTSTKTSGTIFTNATSGTSGKLYESTTTGSQLYWGNESDAGAQYIAGSPANSSFISTGNATDLVFGTNLVNRMSIAANTGIVKIPNLSGATTQMVVASTDGTLSVTAIPSGGGGGTVTNVAVASANGFAGTSSGGTTPTLTLSSTVTSPILASNGTSISAATTTGTGSTAVLNVSPTINGTAVFKNSSTSDFNAFELRGGSSATTPNWQFSKDNTVANSFQLTPSTTNGGATFTTPVFTLLNSGALTLASSMTATSFSGAGTGLTGTATGLESGTATKLATARQIAGVNFDGSSNISLNNNAITNGAGYITSSALSPYAPLASPALTGTPTAPTATAGDNSTKIATTAYVDAGLALKLNLSGGTLTGGLNGTTATFSGDVTANSDSTLKKNIKPLVSISTALRNIGAYSYDWKSNDAHAIGLIAQEVQKYFPELVKTDDKGILSMNYQNFTAVLLAGWKDLDDRITKLEQK